MQLLIAIVQAEDADRLTKQLNRAGIRLTRLRTQGGFLGRDDVTLLTGLEETQVEEVLAIIRQTCHSRKRYINPLPAGTEPAHLTLAAPALPLEVLVGGATVFMIPVKRFARLAGPAPEQPAVPEPAMPPAERGENVMNLVLAILQSDDADPVTRALVTAGFRVTRISTAGGFLRRGNVTLLVGVEETRVDEVLKTIEGNCRARLQPGPAETGMPIYGATVFVLESVQFLHL